MKCTKYTYISPLHGTVVCGDIITDDDGRIDFGPDTVFELYHKANSIESYLSERQEDLVECVPDNLKGLVVRALFGRYTIKMDCMYLATEIFTKRTLTSEEGTLLEEWITGQLSDGWGEGFEQNEVLEERVQIETVEFDTNTCGFEPDSYTTEAYYYLHPWCHEDWELELHSTEEVELDIFCEEPIIHSSYCRIQDDGSYKIRTVYKVPNKHTAMTFIKNSGHLYSDELIRLIDEQGCLGPEVTIYVVYQNEGILCKFLPIIGLVNEDTYFARLFEIDMESGEIDMQEFADGKFEEFYEKLLTK